MNAQLYRYYAKKRTGKSIVARTVDAAAATVAAFSLSYMIFLFSDLSVLLCIPAALASAVVALSGLLRYRRKKTGEYIRAELVKKKEQLMAERLVLMPRRSYDELTRRMAEAARPD